MAASSGILYLGARIGGSERDEHFWNRSVVLMKTKVEQQWLEMVHKAKRKPNYGTRDLDSVVFSELRYNITSMSTDINSFNSRSF